MSKGRVDGVPPRYAAATMDGWVLTDERQEPLLLQARSIIENFGSAHMVFGRNIAISGNAGSGKTHLAVAMAKAIGENHKVRYVRSIRELIREQRESWREGAIKSESECMEDFVWWDLLIIDEFGKGADSKADRDFMYELLNMRYDSKKPTMLITNFTWKMLPDFMGEQLYGRMILEDCDKLLMAWPSYRGAV